MKIRQTFRTFVAAAAVAFALAGAHSWYTGTWKAIPPAEAQPTALFPFVTSTSVTTGSAVQIGAVNPTRRSFEICDGSAAGGIFVLPNLNPAGAQVLPTTSSGLFIAASTCFSPPANLLASGSATGGGQAWNAIAVSNTSVVSFIEW